MNKGKEHHHTGSSRRKFLHQVACLCMATQLPWGLSGCSDNPEAAFHGSGKVPYKVWEEILEALQRCPDYLAGRSRQLAKAKDPEAMFLFVRDEIYLAPASQKAIGRVGDQGRWGIAAALRYGIATPREKAELLTHLYQEAGIEAKVVYERTDIQPEEARQFFLRPIERTFDLEVADEQWARWQKEMQVAAGAVKELPVIDPDASQAGLLADTLWEYLPGNESLKMPAFDCRWDNYRTPTVAFVTAGVTKYAHLFDTAIPFGALKNNGNISNAGPVRLNEDRVDITISYREAIHPDREMPLISGSWKAADLVGRQVRFACLNGLSLAQAVVTPIEALRVFTPTLVLQDFDAEVATMQQQSVVAGPFTLEGEQLLLPETETASGSPVVMASHAGLLKSVQRVTLKAIPVSKPLVRLKVYPYDASGKIVEGLPAGAFSFTDNGKPLPALMGANRQTPKIVLLYDASFSMPKEFFAEKMDLFVTTLRQKVLENYPAAIVDQWATPSELFTWLLKASKTSYDLIVFITDGDNEDVFQEKDEAIYKSGPPAIILNVNKDTTPLKEKTFRTMAAVTNGVVLAATRQKEALEKIIAYVNAMDIAPYSFTCYAGKEEEHEVVLKMDAGRLDTGSRFSFAASADGGSLNQGIVGIYLTLTTKNTTIKRVLAGWDAIAQKKVPPGKEHAKAVKSLILGSCTFYVEGEGPTLAAALADLLKYKLSTRGWGEALMDGDISTAKTAFEKGGYVFHADSIPLMAPLDNGITQDSYTFASGIRIGIFKETFEPDKKIATASFDYLPTSAYVSFSGNDEDRFKINLQKTAQLSIREATLYPHSTRSELQGKALIERKEAIDGRWFAAVGNNEADAGYWYEYLYRGDGNYKIFDKSRLSKAYWQINAQGELYGILKDGTGGGTNSIEQQLKELNFVMDYYMAIFNAMGVANMPVGIVATYGKTLVKLYAIVTEVIIVMDTTGMDAKIAAALKELACNVNKEIMFFALGRVGEVLGSLDLMISLMGGNGLPGLGCS